MQEKFSQDARGFLSYGGLNVFFGGLEAKIGAPDPNVHDAMAAEHTERADSNQEFSTSNYGMTTTSSIEWRFVAEPDQPPEAGWPKETKLLEAAGAVAFLSAASRTPSAALQGLRDSGAQLRQPMLLDEVQKRLDAYNTKLTGSEETEAMLAEMLAARLCE
jgi:hypothetical protein